MCGIVGLFGSLATVDRLDKAMHCLLPRGRDAQKTYFSSGVALGHLLHAVVGHVEQPFVGTGVFVANCEIYNWKDLATKYSLDARNDAELLFLLFEKFGFSLDLLAELDGVYAFAYLRDGKLVLARDILGVKPLWYSSDFSFASEKKALLALDICDVHELNPRTVLLYDLSSCVVSFVDRPFFEVGSEFVADAAVLSERVLALLTSAIVKRIPQQKFGLLFSGGIDSSLLAFLLQRAGCDFTCYTCVFDDPNMQEPEDLVYAQRVALSLGLQLRVISVSLSEAEQYLRQIVPLIEDTNVVKVGVALTFFAACAAAQKDGCKVLFSGLGSEEIFAGYQRHKSSQNVNFECLSGLRCLYERDLYRDDVVSMYHSLELRLPFLDKDLVTYALQIPASLKLHNGCEKYILRCVARDLGLDESFVWRKKKAAQYGSHFHKALQKLAKKNGHRFISSYLRMFYPACNVRLAALLSSGKDSVYALYTMLQRNYDVTCLVSLFSSNSDSFMFHTPTIDLVRLQAESFGIPLLEQETSGEKEKELTDLHTALQRARDEYGVQGVVSGALFSQYQRERIEKVCDSLGLKIFTPLWHVDQETYMRELLRSGFSFILTRVAADGLDASWLQRPLTSSDIDTLVALHAQNGINIAFEGGEAETLMVDGPCFSKKIVLDAFHVEHDGLMATLIVDSAHLE